MKVRITCPHCRFTTEIARERIPEKARVATCPRCRERFPLHLESAPAVPLPSNVEPRPAPSGPPAGETEPAARKASPWERRADLGLWQGIYQSFRKVLFSPGPFFRTLRSGNGYREPLAFGLLFGSLGMMMSLFWEFLFVFMGVGGSLGALSSHMNMAVLFPVLLVLSPVIVGVSLFAITGIMHLFLRIVRGGGHGFEATFRVVSYGQATQIFGVVPFIGGLLATLWLLVVEIVGLREIHGTSYTRVILAFVLPLVLIVAVALAVLIPLTLSLLR